MTATDEILALAASADATSTVTEADLAAFRAAAARGADSAVVRALLAVRPAVAPSGLPAARPAPPSGQLPGDAAWAAWLTTAAAIADGAVVTADRAVFGAAVALADLPGSAPPPVSVTAAIAAAPMPPRSSSPALRTGAAGRPVPSPPPSVSG